MPALEPQLAVLIDAYTALADGDLTPMGDPDHADEVEASAAELLTRLEADCPLDLHAADEN
ncbi:MAG: hypothetical protein S0880_28555 [Actinomycetota bacterium]|nr:hypothetical protein [Actinomycetota bacterium]